MRLTGRVSPRVSSITAAADDDDDDHCRALRRIQLAASPASEDCSEHWPSAAGAGALVGARQHMLLIILHHDHQQQQQPSSAHNVAWRHRLTR